MCADVSTESRVNPASSSKKILQAARAHRSLCADAYVHRSIRLSREQSQGTGMQVAAVMNVGRPAAARRADQLRDRFTTNRRSRSLPCSRSRPTSPIHPLKPANELRNPSGCLAQVQACLAHTEPPVPPPRPEPDVEPDPKPPLPPDAPFPGKPQDDPPRGPPDEPIQPPPPVVAGPTGA